MMKIKTLVFSLRGKAILIATLFIVIFMTFTGYTILSREKALYLKDRENKAIVLVETAGINFTNAILYQEVGLIEETGVIDHYITDLLSKEKDILTVIIFDNTGKVIAHCHLLEHGKFYENAGEVISHQSTLVREVKDKDRGPILEAITPLMIGERRIATLRIEFSLKDFYEKLAGLGKRIIFLTILAISGSIFLTVIGINAMTGPIRRLSGSMDKIDYGKFDALLEKPRKDEIGHLQRSFIGMVRRLKEADIKWENTFNSITDLLSIHSRDYRILKVNNALAQRLHTTPDGLIGRCCWEVYHNSECICPDCPQTRTLKTGESSICEKEYHPLGGTFLTTTFPYLNEAGEIIGTIHIARDITEEKKFHRQLIQSEKMAAMGQMASGIAHEINNPLNSILGYATYLLETVDDRSPLKEELNRIAKAASRCKETVKRFLTLAREAPYRIECLKVKEALEDALLICHYAISSQRIKVKEEIDTDLWINADRGQIEEVFLNIMLNACQAMEDGGELAIKAFKDEEWIKVEIADTGSGISPENMPKIFDPFFTTKEPGKGTGLGMAVSNIIIKNHGGAIECRSMEGEGMVFTIILPEGKDVRI